MSEPRIRPLQDEELDAEQAELLERYRNDAGVLNIYRTLARHPKAARALLGWGRYVLRESGFDPELRELAILRVGWLTKSGYEWTQHSRLARGLGFDAAKIERVKSGPGAEGWSELERLVLRATDELCESQFVSDEVWSGLSRHLSQERLMDLVFIVAHYTQISMILNSFGIQVEAHQQLDEDFRG